MGLLNIAKTADREILKTYSHLRNNLYFVEGLPLLLMQYLLSHRDTPKKETIDNILKEVNFLIEQDIDHIQQGIYPRKFLIPENPYLHTWRWLRIIQDSVNINLKRAGKKHKVFSKEGKKWLSDLPEYYRRNFHFQTDGYLSKNSAELYEHQVEVLFRGTGNAMRRSLLVPIINFATQRGIKRLRILELACGTGNLTKYLAELLPNAEITAIDLSHPYIHEARKKMNKYERVHFMQADATDLPFKDQSFDLVVSCFLFHELPFEVRKEVMAESYRVLAAKGMLAMIDSLQKKDANEHMQWALWNFPRSFHEPFYKNYIETPMEKLFTDLDWASLDQGFAFLSKWIAAQKA